MRKLQIQTHRKSIGSGFNKRGIALPHTKTLVGYFSINIRALSLKLRTLEPIFRERTSREGYTDQDLNAPIDTDTRPSDAAVNEETTGALKAAAELGNALEEDYDDDSPSYQFAFEEAEGGFKKTEFEEWEPVKKAIKDCSYLNDASVYHMLGDHRFCSGDVCKHVQAADGNTEGPTQSTLDSTHEDYIHGIVARRLSNGQLFRLARGVRTQACEGLWSMVVRFTHGKRLHYSGTGRWQSFVRMCACAMNDGWTRTLKDLHKKMKIPPLQIAAYHRDQRELKKQYKRAHAKLHKTVAQRASSKKTRKEQQYADMNDALRHGGTVFGEAVGTRRGTQGGAVQSDTVAIEKCNRCNAALVETHNHFKLPAPAKGGVRAASNKRGLTHRTQVSDLVVANTDVFNAFARSDSE
jgi:hypothetical protein